MATDFFFRASASDITPDAGFTEKLMALTRGSAATSATRGTVAGAVDVGTGLYVQGGGVDLEWFTNPLDAVTISGTITINLRGLESSTMANASLTCLIHRMNNAGTSQLATIVDYESGGAQAELGTAEAALNYTFTPTGTAISAGERLRFYVMLGDGSGVTMASGHTVTFFYDGPTGGASGDSFVRFTETITEQGGGAAPLWLGENRYSRIRYGRLL